MAYEETKVSSYEYPGRGVIQYIHFQAAKPPSAVFVLIMVAVDVPVPSLAVSLFTISSVDLLKNRLSQLLRPPSHWASASTRHLPCECCSHNVPDDPVSIYMLQRLSATSLMTASSVAMTAPALIFHVRHCPKFLQLIALPRAYRRSLFRE
jgi:hypothetical protein